LKITRTEARRFLLSYQGLLGEPWPGSKQAILDFLGRVGSIQYDPLDMVGPNPYLVLQSRFDGFRAADLNELLYAGHRLVDGWDKNMCIYRVEDWPYFQRYRDKAYHHYRDRVEGVLDRIRQELVERGPLTSGDLSFNEKVRWPWGPTRASRAALESMHFWGELVVSGRSRTRKTYDFAGKHISQDVLERPDPNPESGLIDLL